MNEHKTRLSLDDSLPDAVLKMAGGIPGAIGVLKQLIVSVPKIDPDNAMEGVGVICFMDSLGIYESEIWMLYKDVCGEDIGCMIAVLRACQLGFVSREVLCSAIQNFGEHIDVGDLIRRVQEQLPNFSKEVK